MKFKFSRAAYTFFKFRGAKIPTRFAFRTRGVYAQRYVAENSAGNVFTLRTETSTA